MDWSAVLTHTGAFAAGLRLTVILTAIAFLLGTVVGIPLALARLSQHWAARAPVSFVINLLLATPPVIHLWLLYYGLPLLFGIRAPGTQVLVLVLAANQAVVMAENYRAGLQAVPHGMRDASHVLGLSRLQTLRYIRLPLAVRVVIPPTTSSIINLIKDSSLATFIGVTDLTDAGRKVALETFRPIESYTIIALGYFLLSYPIALLSHALERRLHIRWS